MKLTVLPGNRQLTSFRHCSYCSRTFLADKTIKYVNVFCVTDSGIQRKKFMDDGSLEGLTHPPAPKPLEGFRTCLEHDTQDMQVVISFYESSHTCRNIRAQTKTSFECLKRFFLMSQNLSFPSLFQHSTRERKHVVLPQSKMSVLCYCPTFQRWGGECCNSGWHRSQAA